MDQLWSPRQQFWVQFPNLTYHSLFHKNICHKVLCVKIWKDGHFEKNTKRHKNNIEGRWMKHLFIKVTRECQPIRKVHGPIIESKLLSLIVIISKTCKYLSECDADWSKPCVSATNESLEPSGCCESLKKPTALQCNHSPAIYFYLQMWPFFCILKLKCPTGIFVVHRSWIKLNRSSIFVLCTCKKINVESVQAYQLIDLI